MNKMQQLRDKVAGLDPLEKREWPHWDFWRNKLRDDILKGDPDRMMFWHTIRHTMALNHMPYEQSWNLVNSNLGRYRYAAHRTEFAEPKPLVRGLYSRNQIEQCANIAVWEKASGKKIDELESIFEFGGGYGAMALAIRRMGFEGKYVIYDFPEMTYIQEYFLSKHDFSAQWITTLPKAIEADLVIAIHSISETQLPFRADFFPRVQALGYMIRYTPVWMGIDNVRYFDQMSAEMSEYAWTSFQWDDWDSYALMGWKSDE